MGNVKNKQKRGEEMSVFYRDIDVKISNYKSELSKPLVIFERDRGLEIYFNLVEYAYRLDKNPSYLLNNLVGAYATVTLVNPAGYEISIDEVEITEDAKVKFVITEDLTDELTEIGTYQLQIHVNNDVEGMDTSVFSIPPFNFEVRERLKGRKSELLDSEGNKLIDNEGYQLVSATSNKIINFPASQINKYLNSIPTMQGEIKDINSQLDTNTNNIDYINENVKLNNIQNLQGLKRIDIFCGIDSLTAGAGGNSYINFLEPCLRSQLGDGGAGLCMLDYGKSVENNHSFGKSPNVKYMINDSWDSIPRKYSICGLGCYTINADGKQYINYDCKRKYTSAKVIFLKQPNGGTFKIGNVALNVSTYTLVNTLSSDYELGYLDLNINNWTSSGITIKEITGNVAIFGLYFKNGDDGVTVSRLAIAGSKLSEHLKLDENIYKKWFELLEPSAYIFNGGMNDRTEMDTNTYKSSVLSLLSRIKNGCDTTQIILEYCNYSSDYQTTYLKSYEQVLKDIAFENFYGFISDKDVFGNYEKANNKGLMLDEIHPNTKGNKVKANNIAEYLGFNSNYILKEYEQFTSGTSIKEYINELSTVVKTVNFGETETIYKLGLINGYTTAIFEIEIYMQPNSDYSGLKKKIAICGKSATVLNEVTAIHSINESTEFEMKGSNVTMNMVVNCEVVNNKLEIKVTPTATKATTNLLCNLIVTGKVTSCYTGAAGKLVYEN